MSGSARDATHRAETPAQGRPKLDLAKLRTVTPKDYAIRFAFGFVISLVSAGATDVAGPRVGGLFLAFPAILPATLTLVERREGIAQAASDVRGATLGAIGMIAFACVVAALVQRSAALAIIAALLAWVVVSMLMYLLLRAVVHLLGEKQYLPEIPTSEAAELVGALADRRLTVATAESCSGGMVAALLSSVPNTGEVFRGGLVTYTDGLKQSLLGVPADSLRRDGAISGPVAAAMAAGARRVTGADVGIAVTGSTGSSAEGKPPGLTFVAVATRELTCVRRFDGDLGPGRNDERAVRSALQVALRVVTGALDELPGAEVEDGGARDRVGSESS